jgi:hypothetical protein
VISLPAHNVGDKTLTRPGPARRGHVINTWKRFGAPGEAV